MTKKTTKAHRRKTVDYEANLIDALRDPEEAKEYLKASYEDEDPRVFFIALRDVLKAQLGISPEALKKSKLIMRKPAKIDHGTTAHRGH